MHPDGGMLVAEMGNHRIMRFEPGELKGQLVAGTCVAGSGPDELNKPAAVTMHPDGGMLVVDGDNHRIMRFEPGESKGQVVAVEAGESQGQVVPNSSQEDAEAQHQAQRRSLELPTVACETQSHLRSIFSAIDVEELGSINTKQIKVAIKALDHDLFQSEIIEAMLENEGLHQQAEVDFKRFSLFFQVHTSETSEVVSGQTGDAVEEAKRMMREKVQNLLLEKAQDP
jgi:Ca2+-binding EF-hand superfamily protein